MKKIELVWYLVGKYPINSSILSYNPTITKMSSTLDLSSLSLTDLLAERSRIDAEIGVKTGGVGVVAASKGKGKKEKKPSKRAGKATPYGDFSKKVQLEQKDAIKKFKEDNPEVKGAHLKFVGDYKKSHDDEYKAFEAAWKEAHPKSEAAEEESAEAEESESASVASGEGDVAAPAPAAKKRGPKPLASMTPEERAAHDTKVAERKAKKEAEKAAGEAAGISEAPVAPAAKPTKGPKKATKAAEVAPVEVVAPAAEVAPAADGEDEEMPFKLGAQTYVRYGHKGADGETVWASGDLWLSKKGAKGAYAGELQEDGSINADADEPELS